MASEGRSLLGCDGVTRKLQSLFRLEAGDKMFRLPQGVTARRRAGEQRPGGARADEETRAG